MISINFQVWTTTKCKIKGVNTYANQSVCIGSIVNQMRCAFLYLNALNLVSNMIDTNVERILDASLHTWQRMKIRFLNIFMPFDIQMCWMWLSNVVAGVCEGVWRSSVLC